MWILVITFIALQSPPPGNLVAQGFLTIGECQAYGEAKQAEVRERYAGRLIAHFECLRGV
jgi:hypothetical protein